jgi:predicted nucleic acid-binding protein
VSLVLDASLTMSWYFDDEGDRTTDALLDRVADAGAVVPCLWRLEVANAFQVAIRRKRVDAAYRDTAFAELALMPITVDTDTDTYAWTTAVRLAERFGLTLYDAAYLELAQRRSLPLATRDEDLRTASEALALPSLGDL